MPGERGRQRPALKAARRTKIVLGIELEVIRVTVWWSVYVCPCSKNLNDAELKISGLTTLVEEISRQRWAQPAAWLLLTVFSQLHSEIWKQKAEQNPVNMQFGQENGVFKALLANRISTIEEQPITWHQPIRKALGVFQELERPHSSKDPCLW